MEKWKDSHCYKELKKELKKTYRFYFEHGNEHYKEDYKKLFYSILGYEVNTDFELKDLYYYEKLYNECVFDNPLLFYVENVTFSIGTFGVKMIFNYTYDWKKSESIYKRIFECFNKIRLRCCNLNEKETVKAIHDFIVKNVEYNDDSNFPVHQAHSFFVYKKAVCDGISKAAKILLDCMNIRAIVISGNSSAQSTYEELTSGHAWNIIWINDQPDHYDFTFDANLSMPNKPIRYDYYGLSDNQIKQDHNFENLGIIACGNNNWFIENRLYFTKKLEIQKYVNNCINSNADMIYFRVSFTRNPKVKLNNIVSIIKSEMKVSMKKSFLYSLSVNETQMIICIHL